MLGGLKKMVGLGGGEAEAEQVEQHALLGGGDLVSAKATQANTSEAEFIRGPREDIGVEAFALWPGELEVVVPPEWKVGDKVPAQGPHGKITMELPENCQAGTTLRYRLRPEPELLIEVPAGAKPGHTLQFERPDGARIGIQIPMGKQPGEQFEVTPPALMVLVPEACRTGDAVVFPFPGPAGRDGERQWLRAHMP